jgi:hypothetical protein
MSDRLVRLRNGVGLDGNVKTVDGTADVTVLLEDSAGNVLLAKGANVPADAQVGFAKGCIFIKTGGGIATTFYINEDDETGCDFNVGSVGGGDVTGITAQLGLLGTAASGDVTLRRGISVINKTGGQLDKGTLVYLGSYSGGFPTAIKADADTGLFATHVLSADIANDASGDAYGMSVITNLNTDGQTIGDAVYLSATAGGFTFTAPTGADQIVQKVGIVVTVHATTGQILFYPELRAISKQGTSQMQDASVTTAKIADANVTPVKTNIVEAAPRPRTGPERARSARHRRTSSLPRTVRTRSSPCPRLWSAVRS